MNTDPVATTPDADPALSASPAREPAAAVERIVRQYDRPVLFYVLATVIPWACWAAAAYLSHLPDQGRGVQAATAALGLVGLAAPVGVVAWLLRNKPEVRADVWRRLVWRPGTQLRYVGYALFLLLASLLAATAVSVLVGYSPEQFQFRGGFTFSSGLLPVWLILVLAAVLEELAWHSYGTDALVTRMRVFTASMVFVVIWALWHLPLSFIQGYYHSEVVESGWLQAVNFPVSMIPFVLLMNWLYFRSGRSITVAIVFHLTAGFVNEIFLTHPDTKLIQTALLLVFTVFVVARNRELFFAPPSRLLQLESGR